MLVKLTPGQLFLPRISTTNNYQHPKKCKHLWLFLRNFKFCNCRHSGMVVIYKNGHRDSILEFFWEYFFSSVWKRQNFYEGRQNVQYLLSAANTITQYLPITAFTYISLWGSTKTRKVFHLKFVILKMIFKFLFSISQKWEAFTQSQEKTINVGMGHKKVQLKFFDKKWGIKIGITP